MTSRKPLSHAVGVAFVLILAACGPNDADLKVAADKALGGAKGVTVEVAKGVATIAGQFADSTARGAAQAALATVKGLKSVVVNATVAPPVVISADDMLKSSLVAALKDFTKISADVKDGVVTLNGEVAKSDMPKLMQAVSALHPKKIENKAKVMK